MSHPSNTVPPPVEIRALDAPDYPFVRDTWRESYHNAAKVRRMPWALYKATVGKVIDELLSRADVLVLAAYNEDGRVIGWTAFRPGKVATLLYVYTRFATGEEKWRRRGVATALLEAAELGPRVVYCFRAPRLHRAASTEDVLLRMAQRRGVSATYVPVEEFVR